MIKRGVQSVVLRKRVGRQAVGSIQGFPAERVATHCYNNFFLQKVIKRFAVWLFL